VYALVINPILAYQGGYRVDADGFVRIGGLGTGDNPFAFYITIILLITFTRFLLRSQVWYLLFCAILVAWIALTVTRIAVLGAVVGLAVTGLLGAFAAKNRKALIASTAAAVIATAVLLPNALTRSLGFVPTPGELWALVRSPAAMYASINWQGRGVLWAILWASIISAPILGLGLGSSAAIIRETFPDQTVLVAHNEYLRLATDTGILGVALFAAAVIAWLIAAVRLGARGDRAVREYAFPAAAGIAVWAIIAITDNPLDYYSLFTQYIGFLVAGAVLAQSNADETAEGAV
jgi:O-antigen ligase